MEWSLEILPGALKDLRALHKSHQVVIVETIEKRLTRNPTLIGKNLKRLLPNPFAQYELRIAGRFRVLYNADPERRTVTVLLVGEKIGNRLYVRGKEFQRHHEDRTVE